MDGQTVSVGDRVVDLVMGVGAVVAPVTASSFDVLFGSVRRSYSPQGVTAAFGETRTLFWDDPLAGVRPPHKDARIRAARIAAHQALDLTLDSMEAL